MGAKDLVICLPTVNSAKIVKWKVEEGTIVYEGRVILLYDISLKEGCSEQKKLKATQVGTVRKLLVKEGEVVDPGGPLLELERGCSHPTVMNDLCAECGADLRKEDAVFAQASVPMVHSVPELKVSEEQAQILGRADEDRLLQDRKLVLLVDLDQTIIHTTNDNIPNNLKNIYHFQLYGPRSPWYHTRLRPGTHQFLSEISQYYELHICTFGARNYAHMIAHFLDPDGKFFSHRILSRDECFNPNSKMANLKALFPCGDELVCIIDDREDVWNFAPNLIHVKPYHFFQHTGDIHAPPGLTKNENDEKEGYDFAKFAKGTTVKHIVQEDVSIVQNSKKRDDSSESELEEGELRTLRGNNVKQDSSKTADKIEGAEVLKLNKIIENENEVRKFAQISNDKVKRKDKETDNTDEREEMEIVSTDEGESKCVHTDDREDKEKITSVKTEIKKKVNTGKTEHKDNISTNEREDKETVNTFKNQNKEIMNTEQKEGNTVVVKQHRDIIKVIETKQLIDTRKIVGNEFLKELNSTVNDNKESLIEFSNFEDDNKIVDFVKPNENFLEVEESDDYLMYLEEILKKIHKHFYDLYDKKVEGIADLKQVIPAVREKTLAGTKLVFSGLVPRHISLEESKPYNIACGLGAKVTQDLEKDMTHLVAVRSGTAKVNAVRKMKNIKMVTPDWLWICAERWEHVSEELFPVGCERAGSRHPPPHCASPPHTATHGTPAPRLRTPSGRFMDTINPLMSFSSKDIADMDAEVEDIFNESESEGEGKSKKRQRHPPLVESEESSSSSEDSLAGDHVRGWGKKRFRETKTEDDDDDESISTRFRRGGALPSDIELGEGSGNSVGSDEPLDEISDGEWNMMGATLEREFLEGD